jgi:glutaredoxin
MEITIYMCEHCVSCMEALRYFDNQGIYYRKLNVETNKLYFNEMLRLGGIATPFILIDNIAFHYFDYDRISEVLMRADA